MSAAAVEPTHALHTGFNCSKCSYGISLAKPPERCPMCGSGRWTPDRRSTRGA
jgi:rubrerythrin